MTSQKILIYDIEQESFFESKLFAVNNKEGLQELRKIFKEVQRFVSPKDKPEIGHAWYIENVKADKLEMYMHNWSVD